ncbi:MAG TPA: chromate transporter [Chloroflexota bacterium]
MKTPAAAPAPPRPLTLLRVWTLIGLQSFGGGASTQLLIQREFVQRRKWIGADELLQLWNLCLFTPGINLVALTILIGRKLGGAPGIAVSVAGLMLPSAAVTCILAAGFEAVQHSTAVHAILRGVVPATAGIMAVVGANFAAPVAQRAREDGPRIMGICIAIILAVTLALTALRLSAAAVIVIAAVLGVMIFTPWKGVPLPPDSQPLTDETPFP